MSAHGSLFVAPTGEPEAESSFSHLQATARLYFPLGFCTGSLAQLCTALYLEKLACSSLFILPLYIYICLCLVFFDAHVLCLVLASGIYILVAEHRLLIAGSSLIAEHGL